MRAFPRLLNGYPRSFSAPQSIACRTQIRSESSVPFEHPYPQARSTNPAPKNALRFDSKGPKVMQSPRIPEEFILNRRNAPARANRNLMKLLDKDLGLHYKPVKRYKRLEAIALNRSVGFRSSAVNVRPA